MTCYITPVIYPCYSVDILYLEKELINYCLINNYTIHNFTKKYIIKGWHIVAENDYLELVIASDEVSIEFNSSSSLLLAQFSLFIWAKYPVTTDVHLVNGDLSKSYLLQRDSSFEQIKVFLA